MYAAKQRRDGAMPFLLSWLAHRQECHRAQRRTLLPTEIRIAGHGPIRKVSVQDRSSCALAEL
jgi:hypothetical protein